MRNKYVYSCRIKTHAPGFGELLESIFSVSCLEAFSLQIVEVEVSWLKKMKVKSFSRVWLFGTPWTVARQAPLSMGILQSIILEWVAISFSMGFAQLRDGIWVSCTASRLLTVRATMEAPINGESHVWLFVTV